jgi:hypothetical protein
MPIFVIPEEASSLRLPSQNHLSAPLLINRTAPESLSLQVDWQRPLLIHLDLEKWCVPRFILYGEADEPCISTEHEQWLICRPPFKEVDLDSLTLSSSIK